MTRIRLPACFEVSAIAAVAAELRDAQAAGEIAIDAGAVTRVDGAGIQLLCCLAKMLHARGGALVWEVPNPLIHEAARLMGVIGALDPSAER